MERTQALVIDRDPAVRAALREALEQRDVLTHGAESAGEGLNSLRKHPIRVVFVDGTMPGTGTLDMLHFAMQLEDVAVVVALFAEGDPERDARLIRGGVFEVWPQRLRPEALVVHVERVSRQLEIVDELRSLRKELRSREGFDTIVGRSEAMESVRAAIDRLARTDAPVWLEGESGSGKELVGRELHGRSGRAQAPFVLIRCAHQDDPLTSLTSGADASGEGTLYLDEATDLSVEMQRRLAEVLRGGGRRRPPRVLAASRLDPARAVDEGRLLSELHEVLSVERLAIPPLRERPEDIGLLAQHFVSIICQINSLPPMPISPDAMRQLERYTWPGNVQELRGTVENAVILAESAIRPRDLPERIREGTSAPMSLPLPSLSKGKFRDLKREIIESFEKSYLAELLQQFGGNVTTAAHHAGMLRSALQRLLRKYGFKSAEFRRRRSAPSPDSTRDTGVE